MFVEQAAVFGIDLTSEQIAQFEAYKQMLLAWNAQVNLTRIIEPAEIDRRHFLDSLSCVLGTGPLAAQTVIDVGTGGGFPGIPLKIIYPDLQLTLVESVGKKVRFLEAVVAELGLNAVTCLVERAEALGRDPTHREQYEIAVARALAPLPVLAEYLLPLVQCGGRVVAQKGAAARDELAAAQNAITLLGGDSPRIIPMPTLENEIENDLVLVVIEKATPTPDRYPRRVGIPSKRPL